MTFEEYQIKAMATAVYPEKGKNFIYPVLGLVGESGEIADKIKKILRDNGGVINEDQKKLLKKELGDVLWYINALCSELGFKLDDVAELNISKLRKRNESGTLHGAGDER